VAKNVRRPARGLDARMGRPGQAVLFLEQLHHVRAAADAIRAAVTRGLLDKRLLLAALHDPVHRPREEAHPVARVLAALLDTQEIVDFLARAHEEVAVGETLAFPKEHFLLRQPQRAGVLLMA